MTCMGVCFLCVACAPACVSVEATPPAVKGAVCKSSLKTPPRSYGRLVTCAALEYMASGLHVGCVAC